MTRHIYTITRVAVIGPSTLRVSFDDGLVRDVNLAPILRGSVFGRLGDPAEFARVVIDPECAVLVWPCGADIDPATLHDWPTAGAEMAAMAARW